MRRRIGFALIGMVVASLLLAGVGTIVLAGVADRRNDEAELREQTDALRELFREVTLVGAQDAAESRAQRLERLSATMSLEGIGILFLPVNPAAEPIGSLPPGVLVTDLDAQSLRAGEIVSGQKDGLIFAAGGIRNDNGSATLIVLAREPDPVVQPAFRWFLLAGGATVIGAFLVTGLVSRRLTEPVRQTSATAGQIAAGDLSARVDERHAALGGELADLVGSVNSMADHLERSRALERQFLLSVSHDLRTPLTNIRGYAEALTDGATDDPVAVGEIIEHESRRLERLVGDLLLLARLESTGFEFDRARHDLREIIEETIDGLRATAAERGIELEVRVPAQPVPAMVDRDRFGQVITNLVDNAARFARTSVAVTLRFADGQNHLSVADDGPGIDPGDLPHVFERLYVARRDPDGAESGSGLGLAIVRDLVEGMDGSVAARAATAGGAEFVVSLPAP